MRGHWIGAGLVVLVASCSAPVGPDSLASSQEQQDAELMSSATSRRTEIGFVSGATTAACTGTLVAPSAGPLAASRFVLTAAHCVGFRSGEEPQVNTKLTFKTGGTSYKAIRQRVWLETENVSNRDLSSRLRDLALLELEQPVPLSVAKPVRIARTRPSRTESVSLFGYGCTNRCDQTQGTSPRVERVATVPYGQASFVLCPGDSGGPTIDAKNQIVRIHSGFDTTRQNDVFADVVGNAEAIEAQIAAYQTSPWVSKPRVALGDLRTCEACTSAGVDGIGSSGGFWCARSSRCVSFRALAETVCNGSPVVQYAGDCKAFDPRASEDIVGAHCLAATDCRSCESRYNCVWTDRGCLDSPDGSAPEGARALVSRSSPLCCPSVVACNRNGVCERDRGETFDNCRADCPSRPSCNHDGVCDPGESRADCLTDCPSITTCNKNGICEPNLGEWCGTCGDCFCTSDPKCNGNGVCEPNLGETVRTCRADCPVAP